MSLLFLYSCVTAFGLFFLSVNWKYSMMYNTLRITRVISLKCRFLARVYIILVQIVCDSHLENHCMVTGITVCHQVPALFLLVPWQ